MQPAIDFSKARIYFAMVAWLIILGTLLFWMERDTRDDERRLALKAAKAFFQQIVVTRAWNAYHGGVYVPITEDTPPNEYLPAPGRDVTTTSGVKLTRINPAYMTRQIGALAEKDQGGIRFHITSLAPLRPENAPLAWERVWLHSFEQGVEEQGDFFEDGVTTWFRYMAPLVASRACLTCHAGQGGAEGKMLGGISVSIPYPAHAHSMLFSGFGLVTVIGLGFIFVFGALFERKKLLFDAIFNSAIPMCVTDITHSILLANGSYWEEFGRQGESNALKCHEHRPGDACHTGNCPIERIKAGASRYVCEPSKQKDGVVHHYLVTASPLLDGNHKVIGVVESFQDITVRKRLEHEKETLIAELQASLDRVKVLRGLIPICASCKQIRDDHGYWSQVEAYISRHSEAKFSHGICPGCVKKLYPQLSDEILRNASLVEK